MMWGLILGAGLLGLSAAFAQSPAAPAYQLRAGDTLEIAVAGEPAYSGTFLIGADGSILFPDEAIGKIIVAGQTVEAATTNLKNTLAQYLKNPMVSLRISKYRVLVIGEVKNPGSYEMAAGDTAMDAVARAGGGAQDLALLAVQVQHSNGDAALIVPNSAAGMQNLMLRPGDEIIVGPRGGEEPGDTIHISIQGAVNNPGEYTVAAGDNFFHALTKANGPIPNADLKKCSIVRAKPANQVINLDLEKFLNKNDISANPVVQDGDILWVGGRGETRPKSNAFDLLRTIAPFLIFF
jgi:protein involved in polysaccharide export with SLBB domain